MAHKTIAADHSGTEALREVARHFLRRAARSLHTEELSNTAVHNARKDLKKTRTAVRLLRDALGDSQYRRENTRLREAAHTLNAARDTKVMVQTLQTLRRAHRQLRGNPEVVRLERLLLDEQMLAQRRLRQRFNGSGDAQQRLRRLKRRADRWAVGKHGWSALGPAIKRIYKSGRRTLPAANASSAASGPLLDNALHEWRKQVKYLRYALQMLAPIRPTRLPALARQAQQLTDSLGEAHDLALLEQKVRTLASWTDGDGHGPARRQPPPRRGGAHPPLQRLLEVIERRHERLSASALIAGERLYRRRPSEVDRELEAYWRSWRKNARG